MSGDCFHGVLKLSDPLFFSFLPSDGSRNYLSAALPFRSKVLILSFPDGYLGDRRTAYSQMLSLDLMVERASGVGCEMALVIVGQLSRRRRSVLRIPLICPAQPTLLQVLLQPMLHGLSELSMGVVSHHWMWLTCSPLSSPVLTILPLPTLLRHGWNQGEP